MTKACPFCAEQIQEAAIKCKHCGEFLTKEVKETKSSEYISSEVLIEPQSLEKNNEVKLIKKVEGAKHTIFALIGLALILIFQFDYISDNGTKQFSRLITILSSIGDTNSNKKSDGSSYYIYCKYIGSSVVQRFNASNNAKCPDGYVSKPASSYSPLKSVGSSKSSAPKTNSSSTSYNDYSESERKMISCMALSPGFSGSNSSCINYLNRLHDDLLTEIIIKLPSTVSMNSIPYCKNFNASSMSSKKITSCIKQVNNGIKLADNYNRKSSTINKSKTSNSSDGWEILGGVLGILGGIDAVKNPQSYSTPTTPTGPRCMFNPETKAMQLCHHEAMGKCYHYGRSC